MIFRKWNRMWSWRYYIVGAILFLILLLAILFIHQNNSKTNLEQPASIVVMQGALPTSEKKDVDIEQRIGQRKDWIQYGWPIVQSKRSLRDAIWDFCIGILPENGYLHIASAIPLLLEHKGAMTKIIAEEEAYYATALISDIWKHSFEKVGNLTLSDDVQVILYHTHNAETYQPDDGVSKVTGQNGGIVEATKVFQNALQKKYGIRTAHSTTIHDYPDWSRAYQNSLNTAKQLLKAYPKAKAVFDIHRDAGFTSKKTTTTIIQGRNAAKIMLVIGCNHANWQENLAFARLLEAKANELYPGLLRDNIRIKETGRYNQQIDGHAVLLEIGSDLNTQEEADFSMECFAHVVYEVLKDMGS